MNLNHIKELDGLRGFAVLIVILYHFFNMPILSDNNFDVAFKGIFSIGWIGVDLFFVLSGFLITRILLNTKKGKNYFTSFYYKRTLRIFPLYYIYLVLIFFIIYPSIFNRVNHVEQIKILVSQENEAWFWLYISNIKQFFSGVFFGGGLGHLWSLSIEEQFYIAWPLIVYYSTLPILKRIAIGFVLSALVLRMYCHYLNFDMESIYVFTLTRIDTLAMGTFIAIFVTENRMIDYDKVKKVFYPLAFFTIIFICGLSFSDGSHPLIYTIGFTFIGMMFAVLVLILQSPTQFFLRSMFATNFFIFLGKYSYAIYIFHPLARQVLVKLMGEPKMIFGTQVPWMILFVLLCCLSSVLVALISWNVYEKWFLKLKGRYFVNS